MSHLVDKFHIIENQIENVSKDELVSLLNNYIENIFLSDEKVLISDLITQILYFKNDINFNNIMINHFTEFLKQKKNFVRNSIKKGNFEMEHLIKLIDNFNQKFVKFDYLENTNYIKMKSKERLFEEILSDPSIINFLKNELCDISDNNKKTYIALFDIVKDISTYSGSESYFWFLFLVSSCMEKTIEEISNKSLPVPKTYENLLHFISLLTYFKNMMDFFSFVTYDVDKIYYNCISHFYNMVKVIFENNSINEIITVFDNNLDIIKKIVSIPNLKYNDKNIKDFLSLQLVNFINTKLTKNEDNSFNTIYNLGQLLNIFNNLLDNYPYAQNLINVKISDFFLKEENQNILIESIHQKILEGSELNEFIGYFNFVDKDRLIAKYNRKLIERLLHKPNIEQEKKYCNIIGEKLNEKLLFKTNKIIDDVEKNKNVVDNLKSIKLPDWFDNENVNFMTMSYGNWDIDQNEGLNKTDIISNYSIGRYMTVYDNFYNQKYENRRKLYWQLHFGEAIIRYHEKRIKLMPIQLYILEYIFEKKSINKDELMSVEFLKGYNDNFRKSLISSLILGGILKISDNNITINPDTENISSDYIDIFFTTSNYGEILEKMREENLMLSREDILSANINHYVKQNPTHKKELYEIIKRKLSVFFFLENNFYEKVITSMIDKEYIRIDDEIISKILW